MPKPWKISQNCIDLVKKFEGLRLQSYQDTGGVWTIGWGHTAGVQPMQVITESQADAFLAYDLNQSSQFVNKCVLVDLTQNQFDALVDFDFNEGAGHLGTSTLLHLLNQCGYSAAAHQFSYWIYGYVNGKLGVIQDLVERRAAEQALFLKP